VKPLAPIHLALYGSGRHGQYLKKLFHGSGESVLWSHEFEHRRSLRMPIDFRREVVPEGVVIATPDDLHAENILELFNSGEQIWVFCEKPVASKLGDLKKIERCSDAELSRLFVNLPLLDSTLGDWLKELATSQPPGRVHAVWSKSIAWDRPGARWRLSPERNPLGVASTVGIHFLALLISCFGTPNSLVVDVVPLPMFDGGIGTARMHLQFSNLWSACIDLSWFGPERREIVIHQREDSGMLRGVPKRLRFSEPTTCLFDDGNRRSISQFLDVVRGWKPPSGLSLLVARQASNWLFRSEWRIVDEIVVGSVQDSEC